MMFGRCPGRGWSSRSVDAVSHAGYVRMRTSSGTKVEAILRARGFMSVHAPYMDERPAGPLTLVTRSPSGSRSEAPGTLKEFQAPAPDLDGVTGSQRRFVRGSVPVQARPVHRPPTISAAVAHWPRWCSRPAFDSKCAPTVFQSRWHISPRGIRRDAELLRNVDCDWRP